MLGDVHHKVNGQASVDISLHGFPKGTHTKTAADGVFKEVKLNRGHAGQPETSDDLPGAGQ